MILVEKRDGTTAAFNMEKITVAIKKCFTAEYGEINKENMFKISKIISAIYEKYIKKINHKDTDTTINIEHIQDYVVSTLIDFEEHNLAQRYTEYRLTHKKLRDELLSKTILVKYGDNESIQFSIVWIKELLEDFILTYNQYYKTKLNIDIIAVLKQFKNDCYSGINVKDLLKTLAISVGTFTVLNKDYSTLVGIIYTHQVHNEVKNIKKPLDICNGFKYSLFKEYSIKEILQHAVNIGLVTEQLIDEKIFDFDKLSRAINHHRDFQLQRHGAITLYEKYLLIDRSDSRRIETYQSMYMRIAMGISLKEDNPTERAIEFYNEISKHKYSPSTPTLFNSGLVRPQLSSCYVSTIQDSLDQIFDAYKQNALLSKYAGGIGNDWTNVRSLGSMIKGTNGKSQGVIPFLKINNDVAVAVNQGGKRKGAICAYLETWHADIEEFVLLRKETGDERRRTHDMNTAVWVPDLFMQRMLENKNWTLFSPSDVPDLHSLYGENFTKRYEYYEELVAKNELPGKSISALTLWRNILSMLFETGHPWITFKDRINITNPQKHVGSVHSSNLCTEITLNTSKDEIAVCNLGSLNLIKFITIEDGKKKIDIKRLGKSVITAVRMLDNTIDNGFYPVEEAKNSNIRHRPLGLGIMGFNDLLLEFKIPFDSKDAVHLSGTLMDLIQMFAHYASNELGKVRGAYSSYEGSLYSQIHEGNTYSVDEMLDNNRLKETYSKINPNLQEKYDEFCGYTSGFITNKGALFTNDYVEYMNSLLRACDYSAMRNSNVTSIAPTATIANIVGVSQSIEPIYKNIYVKSDLCGEFINVNQYLVNDLTELGLWNKEMINKIMQHNGSIQNIPEIPDDIKRLYKCAHEIEPKWFIYNAAARQHVIDQAQSLNIYIAEPNGKLLHETYTLAWLLNLKSTYYLRSLGENTLEKSNQQSTPKVCSIDNPDCESCQ